MINLDIHLTFEKRKMPDNNGNLYRAIETHSQLCADGKTIEEAENNFMGGLANLYSTLFEKGGDKEAEEYFKEHNFKFL